MNSIIFDNEEYRYVELRNRGKFISKNGKAINPCRRNQKATIYYSQDGYPCFGGGIPVHLYVAYGWVDGHFDGAEVNHKDFDRTNFCADNLEWVTHLQNVEYSNIYNRDVVCKGKQGTKNGRATFSECQVMEIRKKYDEGYIVANIIKTYYPNLQTSKDYHNIYSTFSNIVKRKTWKHI